MSETEPELGLGIIKQVDNDYVEVLYSTSKTVRKYTLQGAPLKRVVFKIGDEIQTKTKKTFLINEIKEIEGLHHYICSGAQVCENEIDDTTTFNTPQQRLFSHSFDSNSQFTLRNQALIINEKIKKSSLRGLIGARIELMPHQLYITHEIAERHLPRILLSDEVGLGKTIEACLIVHRLLLMERISRVLIIVPDNLIYQWRAELLCRFNVYFSMVDEKFCQHRDQHKINPFNEFSLYVIQESLLTDPHRVKQITTLDWDMMVIDEAHHYQKSSSQFKTIQILSEKIKRIILMTAVPEQLGLQNHFQRLSLLDANRFYDFESFKKEYQFYKELNVQIEQYTEEMKNANDSEIIKLFKQFTAKHNLLLDIDEKSKSSKKILLNQITREIVDRYGTSRVMYRNSRKNVKGLPKRKAILIPLEDFGNKKQWDRLKNEFLSDYGITTEQPIYYFANDARARWLLELLGEHPDRKFVLICRTKEKVRALNNHIKNNSLIKTALFTEDQSIEERDKSFIWFRNRQGAQILLCSEIGSEGRNFQVSQELILFDLPADPELLEQRIGRLDRIGQENDIYIHLPFIKQSAFEILVNWYEYGLNAFTAIIEGGDRVKQAFADKVLRVASSFHDGKESESGLSQLVRETKEYYKILLQELESGRDKLLEMNSYSHKDAMRIKKNVEKIDTDVELEKFMLDVFEHAGFEIDDKENRTYHLKPGILKTDLFPVFSKQGITITFDRKTALLRDDFAFITQDHPYVERTLSMLINTDIGNCSFGMLYNQKKNEILIETIFIIEIIAPKQLAVDRFLPSSQLRTVVSNSLELCHNEYNSELLEAQIENPEPAHYDAITDPMLNTHLKKMIIKAETDVQKQGAKLIQQALLEIKSFYEKEIARLKFLAKKGESTSTAEIDSLTQEKDAIIQYTQQARIRQYSLRLILVSGKIS